MSDRTSHSSDPPTVYTLQPSHPIPLPTYIHSASLGSDFATLPGGDRLPDEEDAERGEDSSGHGNGRLESEMEEEEPDLSPVRTLPDLEAGEAGAAGDDLDATRTRGRCHPSSAPSPTPALPGVAPAAAAAAAPAPPLFPPVSGHGFAAHHAHAFVPPALATTTPLSSSSSSSKQLHQVPLPPSVGAGTAAAAAAVAAAAVAPPTGRRKELGTRHVLMTSAETMWGVLIFLRFGWCVGNVGLVPTLGAVLLSAACQALCASSLSAVATNGLVTRSGGENGS